MLDKLKVKFLNFGKHLNNNEYSFVYSLEDVEDKSILQVFGMKFRSIIAWLIYDLHWKWLEWIISAMATMEMELYLLFDKELQEALSGCNVAIGKDENGDWITKASQNIPKNTLYCDDCAYGVCHSRIADFFYGHQCCGYCYYLGKGDFSFIQPTDLLWDCCKCCGINEDIEIDEDEYYSIGQEQLRKIRENNETRKINE